MRQLIEESKTWIIDNEQEAIDTINEFRNDAEDKGYQVKKGTYTMKVKKSKGEIIDVSYKTEVVISYEV